MSNTLTDKLYIIGLVTMGIILFVVLSQPAWRGKEMVAEMRTNCDKRGGVMLENKRTFGIVYECAGRLD